MRSALRWMGVICVAVIAGSIAGCQSRGSVVGGPANTALLTVLDLSQPVGPIVRAGDLQIAGASGETIGFSLQVGGLAGSSRGTAIHWQPPHEGTTFAQLNGGSIAAWQVVDVPVNLNRAAYIRHTGLSADTPSEPRALLPLAADNGRIDLSQLRDASQPADAQRPPGQSAALWVDLHLPANAPAGLYEGRVDLLDASDHAIASVPVRLTVYDFALPAERHLHLIAPLEWDRLTALYADRFEALRPTLLNRAEPRFARAMQELDALVSLAHENRCDAYVPRLGPVVKWPVGQLPEVDWDDFVTLITPWMTGSGFADHQPTGLWPLPRPDLLPRFDRQSQLDYWQNAANRFEQNEWLPRSAIFIDPPHAGRLGTADSVELSSFAGSALKLQSHVRVAVPLETDQVKLASPDQPNWVDPSRAGRLMCSAPGLVFSPPMQSWPSEVSRPQQWLRTDLPGLLPGAGDGPDIRLFGWLAYLRQAEFVRFPGALPMQSDLTAPADPTDFTWFYPGEWFGLDQPVPTLQLKWLRQAEDDYEYLWLAANRGDAIGPLLLARAITKPVQVLDHQSPDPIDTLMTGTTDPGAWATVRNVLAKRIALHVPGVPVDANAERAISVATLHWLEPQDRQFQLARSVQYILDRPGGDSVTLRMNVNIYNASDDTPASNTLAWSNVPPTWTIAPQALTLPSLGMFSITPTMLNATVRLDHLPHDPVGSTPKAAEWTFTNGFTHANYPMRAILPVAAVDRRDSPLKIDGSLEDWDAADAIQNGPLVRMLDRPTVQRQAITPSTTAARIYASWADENFYCGFHLGGVTAAPVFATRNDVSYDDRRAWDEDLCEVLIQPQYDDNTLGDITHLILKPTGQWTEKLFDRRTHAEESAAIDSSAIRYASTVDGDAWRGELAIPWKVLLQPGQNRPTLLRFNVVHHVNASGESSSWAGPIDYGRERDFMGLIYLREPATPNFGTR